jgi:biotin synthase-related radical SAM superfamily protein
MGDEKISQKFSDQEKNMVHQKGEILDRGLLAETKALLLSIGSADIDPRLLPDSLKTTATAGPGAGGSSFFLCSGDHRVRLSIKPDSSLKVIPWNDGVAVQKEGRTIAYGTLEIPLCHCPQQAYITVSERCIFDCKFCPVPKLNGHVKTLDEIVALVEAAQERGDLRAISLTSGVAESPEQEVSSMTEIVSRLADRFDLPIGVSVYPTATSSEDLHAAGAVEIKYNVETMDRAIFDRACPGLSLDYILTSLDGAVRVFGKNRVFTNFIIGLGETDDCVRDGVETLASMGIITSLRPISPHPLRKGEIVIERPSASRLLSLTRLNKSALKRHGLDPRVAQTMCLPCTGCDLTPWRDL